MKNSVIDWLLEENQPSVRYLTLTELLGRSEKEAEVKSTKENIANIGWAKDILEKQNPGGYWIDQKSLYWPKYVSTNWMLLILSDLGLTKEEPRVEKACQKWMKRFGKKDGGFDDAEESKTGHLCIPVKSGRAV